MVEKPVSLQAEYFAAKTLLLLRDNEIAELKKANRRVALEKELLVSKMDVLRADVRKAQLGIK